MDWHEVEKKKIDAVRAMAKEKNLVDAVAGLSKEELVAKLAESLGIPRPHKLVEGADKAPIKARIRQLQAERDQALADGDRPRMHRAQHEIHRHKRELRRMAHMLH